MLKRVGLIGSLLAGLACGVAAYAQVVSNPILQHADPFITLNPVDGKYLLLATTGHDVTIWSGPGVTTSAGESKVVFTPTDGLSELWSPTIWKIDGKWWIYFTARAQGKEHAIYVLESDTADALGSYTYRGALDLGRPAIDPSVLTVGGKNYLMYVTVDRGENAISIIRLDGGMRAEGKASLIAEPEFPWEKGEGSTKNYPVDEGPTALYHAGKTFIVFSGSDTASPKYCLGLLTFKGGDPLERANWVKTPQPVFSASPADSIYGPGRGTFAHAADGSDWLLYAAKSTDAPSPAHRAVRAQRFAWKANGSPDFGTPLPDGPVAEGVQGPQMAITFDDLPAHGAKPPATTRMEIAQSVLKTLKQEKMPPTYGFINGVRTEEDPSTLAVLQAWRAAGQPLGNHTWTHGNINDETPEQFETDVTKNEPLLKQLMGDEDWHWLRYPFLHEGDTVEKRRAVRAWLFKHGYKIAQVNMDFEDYLWNAPYARCVATHDDVSIQKLHDSYLSVADQYYGVFRELSQMVYGRDVKYVLLMHLGAFDAKMLPELLAMYRSKGVSFISLPEAESDPAYKDDPDLGIPGGGALLEQMMQSKKLKFPPNTKPYKELDAMCR